MAARVYRYPEYHKAWSENNKDRLAEYRRNYYLKNREDKIAYSNNRYWGDVEERRKEGRDRYSRNPALYIEKSGISRRRRFYGLGRDDFRELLRRQGGLCAICTVPMVPGGDTHVDHDHTTGEVRGLLCRKCNTAVGRFEYKPWSFTDALEYLG